MEIIIGREGNQKTPISDRSVSRRHCKVTSNPDGSYTIENLSDAGTLIDGRPIIKTTVSPDTRIQLGNSFSATLSELIGPPMPPKEAHQSYSAHSESPGSSYSARPNSPSYQEAAGRRDDSRPKPQTYHIGHLRRVYDGFNNTNIEMADAQRRTNLVRTASAVFTMSAAIVAALTSGSIGWILTGIGVVGNVYSFFGMKNSETAAEKQQRQNDFDDAWVCPNPKCGHSIMAPNDKRLVRDFSSCPYCRCRYIE